MKVAIKRLRLHLGERQGFGRFHPNECNIWSMLDHVNILPLLGFVQEGKAYALVSEWMEDGTLCEYLQNRIRCPIEDIILGIANGVDYLHGQNLVHCNLKADKILINSLGKPLICGFGNSRKLQIPYVRTFEGLEESIRWMAYKLFDFSGDRHHTKESDVWAFGMTVYEILSKQLPYAHLENNAVVFCTIFGRYAKSVG
ncbi:kinase-like protein [Fomitiporia mediterranea MF3/22]|uniref:kinase-like protein n=1 Tax=Fomitiporia mediterranea (strain MF3/22) TaxID=694068 RepID=UPI000440897C|nr:kinase-like protein [Fomitiporia mediterranea MF3/22]EJC99173.1 kinase-like protein [Fomitiporia mediterranea MF3/22]